MSFRLEMVNEVRDWLHLLRRTDRNTAVLIGQAISALLDEGPNLGRPLVDRIKGGKWSNWYREAIPTAETRYATYLKEMEQP